MFPRSIFAFALTRSVIFSVSPTRTSAFGLPSADLLEFSSLPIKNPKILSRRGSARFRPAASSRHRQTLNYSSQSPRKNASEKIKKYWKKY
jgi:hypothetical protein